MNGHFDYFDRQGHITSPAFDELISGEPDELSRLELSEHLSFCDSCLDRYGEALDKTSLLTPPEGVVGPVKKTLKDRLKNTVIFKYMPAAAAAILAMALWVAGFSKISDLNLFMRNNAENRRDSKIIDELSAEYQNPGEGRSWIEGTVEFTKFFSGKADQLTKDIATNLNDYMNPLNNGKGDGGNEKE